jgi:tetratricopeptide (TPR) repeat protein
MNIFKSSLHNPTFYLILLTAFALPTTSNAESYEFKVVFAAEVPGSTEIDVGNYDAAIEILESRAKDSTQLYITDELATLCALYVVKRRLEAAHRACHNAVETDQSHLAYNNRGVLRAHLGDAAGAVRDFERARVLPTDRQRYIKELMRGDARLIASGNYAVAVKYVQKHGRPDPVQAFLGRVGGANVEELGY